MQKKYKSVFFSREWVMEKYFGWNLFYEDNSYKILQQRKSIFTRYLVLVTGVSFDAIYSKLVEFNLFTPLNIVIVHNFSTEVFLEKGSNSNLSLSDPSSRLLNNATFVVDLSKEQNVLWKNLGAKSRNMCKKAKSNDITITLSQNPDKKVYDKFFELYSLMASKKGLVIPNEYVIKDISDNNDFLVVSCVNSDDDIVMVNLVYLCENTAFYMYGAAGGERVNGLGQLAQWKTINQLKDLGYDWYDLGGVSTAEQDGIYKFKKSIGGEYMSLGCEYAYTPLLIKCANIIHRLIK